MQRSLAWLALIGAALYAVSTWPFADAVSHRNGEKISSGPTSPALGSKRADYFAAAQIDLPTPQPALSPEPPADAAIDEKSTAGLDPATSSVGQAERLVVRLVANIRSEPSSKSTLIGTANVGAELEVAERQARWIRFVDPATSHTGWIYEGLLTPLSSESSIRPTAASAGKAVSPIANVPRRAVRPAASPRAPKQRVGGRAGSQDVPNFQQVRSFRRISGGSGPLLGGECSENDCSAGISLRGRRDGRSFA